MWFLDTYVYEVTVQNYTEGPVRRNPENTGRYLKIILEYFFLLPYVYTPIIFALGKN